MTLGGLVKWFLSRPLSVKLAGANALLLVVALAALWVTHQAPGAAWRVFAIATVALAAGAVVNVVLVALALRPLRDLEAATLRVWKGDLGARVSSSPIADTELSRIGRTLNLLLDGLMADRARMRLLASEVIRAGDRERAALARELHDSTAQSLAALTYQLLAVERSRNDPALAAQLTPIRDAANDILVEVRRLSHIVHPRILDDLGLVSALRQLGRTAADGATAEVAVDVPADVERAAKGAPREVESVLYRVAQEGLQNALRHARATHVRITLERPAGEIRLRVTDDGIGFDPEEAARRRPGMGLFTMRERVSLVRGRFEIEGGPGRGTTVMATVPMTDAPPAAQTTLPMERTG